MENKELISKVVNNNEVVQKQNDLDQESVNKSMQENNSAIKKESVVQENNGVKLESSFLDDKNNDNNNDVEKKQGIVFNSEKASSEQMELPKVSENEDARNNIDIPQVVEIPKITEEKASTLPVGDSNHKDISINNNSQNKKDDEQVNLSNKKRNPFVFFLNNDKKNKSEDKKHSEVDDKVIEKENGLKSKDNEQNTNEMTQSSELPNEVSKIDDTSSMQVSNQQNQINQPSQMNQSNQMNQIGQQNQMNQVGLQNQLNPQEQQKQIEQSNVPDFSTIFNVQSEEENNNVKNKEQVLASLDNKDQTKTEVENSILSENRINNVANSINGDNQVSDNNNLQTPNINPQEIVVIANAKEIAKNKEKETEQPKEVKKQPKKGVFNNEEKVIYEYVPEKEGNPIGVAIFFLLLFSFIVILPIISKKYNYSSPEIPTTPTDKEVENSEIYYFNKSSVRASLGGLEFTNFVKSKENNSYYLTFNITNTNEKAYQYDKKYYVTFYDGESIAYRALIHSYEAIGSNSVQEITLTINERGFTNADRFKIEEIPVSMYPEVSTTETEGDYNVLTCAYQNDSIKYYFQDNKLIKLREEYDETLENSTDIVANKAAYKALSDSYKRVRNFSSTFIETNNGFTMINEFNHKDIPDATLFNLKTYKFFKYNENINIVSFELESQGYNCG